MSSKIEIMVSTAVSIANDDTHGYDQTTRLGGVDFDCSSLVTKAVNTAGFGIPSGCTTRNLRDALKKVGFVEVPVTSERKRGDIFLRVGHHVVMCTDANNIVHASINEKGTATGGQTGDQTGKEICVRSFYQYKTSDKTGWDYCLRYPEVTEQAQFPYWSIMEASGVRFRSAPNKSDSSIMRSVNNGYVKVGDGLTVGEPAVGIFSPVVYGGHKGYVATMYLPRTTA